VVHILVVIAGLAVAVLEQLVGMLLAVLVLAVQELHPLLLDHLLVGPVEVVVVGMVLPVVLPRMEAAQVEATQQTEPQEL
jgi:hypothetical protein